MIVKPATVTPLSSLAVARKGDKPPENFAVLLEQKVFPAKNSHRSAGNREEKNSENIPEVDVVLTPPLLAMLPAAQPGTSIEPATLADLLPAADMSEQGRKQQLNQTDQLQLDPTAGSRLLVNTLETASADSTNSADKVKAAPGARLWESTGDQYTFSAVKPERKEGLSAALSAGFFLKAEPVAAADKPVILAEHKPERESSNLLSANREITGMVSVDLSRPVSVRSEFPLLPHQPVPGAGNSGLRTEPGGDLLLNQKLGSPEWQQSLGQQVSLFTRNGIHHAELRLHPEELGALQVHLRLNSEQAQLHFVTGNHQVKAALEAAMPQLRTMLEESGVSLGKSSVGADASSWGAPSHSGQDARSSQHQQRDADDHYVRLNNEQAAEAETGNSLTVQRINLPDGINTFV